MDAISKKLFWYFFSKFYSISFKLCIWVYSHKIIIKSQSRTNWIKISWRSSLSKFESLNRFHYTLADGLTILIHWYTQLMAGWHSPWTPYTQPAKPNLYLFYDQNKFKMVARKLIKTYVMSYISTTKVLMPCWCRVLVSAYDVYVYNKTHRSVECYEVQMYCILCVSFCITSITLA